jgi:hypothetical protein
MSMKHRIAIEIPGVPVNETARWQPLAAHLEAFHGALGPVVVWRDKHVLAVIVATEADTPVDAVMTAVLATTESLSAIGLGEFYPTAIDVRNADTDAPIPAHTDKTLAARQRHERQRDLVAKSLRRSTALTAYLAWTFHRTVLRVEVLGRTGVTASPGPTPGIYSPLKRRRE